MFLSVTVANTTIAQQQAECPDPPKNPTVDARVLCEKLGNKNLTDSITIVLDDFNIATTGENAHAVGAVLERIGNIHINIRGGVFGTESKSAYGVYARYNRREDQNLDLDDRNGSDIVIDIKNTEISTKGDHAHGIYSQHNAVGNIDILVRGGSTTTNGNISGGIFGFYRNDYETIRGNIRIDVRNHIVTTEGKSSHAVRGWLTEAGNINIYVEGGSLHTKNEGSFGIEGRHGLSSTVYPQGIHEISIDVQGVDIDIEGKNACGILGWMRAVGGGDTLINVTGSSIDTFSDSGLGVFGLNSQTSGSGGVNVGIKRSLINTSGAAAYGIFGLNSGTSATGDVRIGLESSSVETAGAAAHGIYAGHASGEGQIAVLLDGTKITADGAGSSGVQIGRFNSSTMALERIAKVGSDGLRRQTVIVWGDSPVRGGSGDDAAGVYLVGGGRVVIRGGGSLGAKSGTAIRSARKLSTDPAPDLRVDLYPGARPIWQLLAGNIVNDGGRTFVTVHDKELYDSDEWPYTSSRWVPNGAKDVALASNFVEMEFGKSESYIFRNAPRAAVYEALPGFLLRLDDMGVSGERFYGSDSPTWVRISGVRGSFRPSASSVGARYSFDRYELAAGLDFPLKDELTAGLGVRQVSGGADVLSPDGGGEFNILGHGLTGEMVWRNGEGFHAAARISAMSYDLDLSSSTRGTLASNIDTAVLALGAEAGQRFALADSMVTARGWLNRSEASMEGLTDAVRTRLSIADGSRTAVGIGIAGWTDSGRGGFSHSWSLGVERQLSGGTVVLASGEHLVSRGPNTRLMLGLGAEYRLGEATLAAGISAIGHGSDDRSVSADIQFGTRF